MVASPSDVIADDLQRFRFGLHQRWQTKRGLPGKERIVDLLQLDIDTSLFPKSDRDNFSESIGPTTYSLLYHIGDRFDVISDGYFDFFSTGLRSLSAGVRTSRPGLERALRRITFFTRPNQQYSSTANWCNLNEKWIASANTT